MSTQASSFRPLSGISSFQTFLHYAIFLRQEINVTTRTDLFSAIWIWIFHLPPNQQDPVNDSHLSSFSCPFSRSTISESVSDWLTVYLVCLSVWLADQLAYRLAELLTDLLVINDQLTDWLCYWLTHRLTDCFTDWPKYCLTDLLALLLTDFRSERLSYWLTVLLTDWLTDWLPSCDTIFTSHKMTYALANRGSINQLIWLVG